MLLKTNKYNGCPSTGINDKTTVLVCLLAKRITHNNKIYKLHDGMALSTFLCLKTLQWAHHLVRMDFSCILKEVMRECFRERRPVGEHNAKDLLPTQN